MGAVYFWCWVMGAVWLLMLLLPFCWVLALRRVCCCFCCRAQIVPLRVRRLAALERQKEFTDRGGTAPPAGAAKTTTVRSHCPAASCQVLKERKKNGHSPRQLNARPPIDAACCWPGSQNVSGCGRRRVAVRRRRRHRPRPPPQPVRAADPVHHPDTLPCFPGHVKISLILSSWLRRRKRFACRDSGRGRAAGHSDVALAVGGTVRQRRGQALPRGTTPKPAAVLIRNQSLDYSFI